MCVYLAVCASTSAFPGHLLDQGREVENLFALLFQIQRLSKRNGRGRKEIGALHSI